MPRPARTGGSRSRTPDATRAAADYQGAVDDWTSARAALWADLLAEHLTDGKAGAFLAWGDPAFYDSTIRVLDLVRLAATLPFEIEVIPGISSLQALAAAHRISLTRWEVRSISPPGVD